MTKKVNRESGVRTCFLKTDETILYLINTTQAIICIVLNTPACYDSCSREKFWTWCRNSLNFRERDKESIVPTVQKIIFSVEPLIDKGKYEDYFLAGAVNR